jgi:chromosome partitioning protein
MKTVAFFNNKGGVGKTSLVYHLSWMYAELGLNVVAADFDPQANLTAMFLPEERLEELWTDGEHPNTVLGCVAPILDGIGDIRMPHVESIADRLGLIAGDLGLSSFEDKLSECWPRCVSGHLDAFRWTSAFYRILVRATEQRKADLVLIDVGPNLGAINRSALTAADSVVVPLAPDLFSLQGLRNLGPCLRTWRRDWTDRLNRKPDTPAAASLQLPRGDMNPVGYVVLQHAVRLDRPVKAYERWMARIPTTYDREILNDPEPTVTTVANDPNCLASLKNYRSLMPLAQDALKPMFYLKAADGALGAHISAVQSCHDDFRKLAIAIAEKCEVQLPEPLHQSQLSMF